MPFDKPTLSIVIACFAIGSASCSSVPVATGCSQLARPILTQATPHAELDDSGDAVMDARLYALAETGQLNRANDDKRTGFDIIAACEQRDAQTRHRLERAWRRFGL